MYGRDDVIVDEVYSTSGNSTDDTAQQTTSAHSKAHSREQSKTHHSQKCHVIDTQADGSALVRCLAFGVPPGSLRR